MAASSRQNLENNGKNPSKSSAITTDDDDNEKNSSDYRMRFIYCSIGATLMCLGVIVLVSGLAVYILCSTGSLSTPHWNDGMSFHQRSGNYHESSSNYASIIWSIVLASIGIAFITVSIVFTVLACLTDGRIDRRFNQGQKFRNNNQPNNTTHAKQTLHEQEKLIPSTTPTLNHKDRDFIYDDGYDETDPNASRQNPQQHRSNIRININPGNQSPIMSGDINQIGLPMTPQGKRLPHNGFTYLVNPAEIQAYHENHQQNRQITSPMFENRTTQIRTQQVTSRESVI